MLAGVLALGGVGLTLGWAQSAPVGDFAQIRAKADKGDLESLNILGNVYTNGLLGQRQDFAEALAWYRRAAEKGFAPAQFNLGLAYELGRGVPADERQAFRQYLMAAEQGFAAAQFNVGNMYSAGRGVGQDLFEANLWYKQAAEKGVVEAQFNLGLAYEAGRGVKPDEVQAARWYKQAADRGFARAQYNLGLLLEDGRGVAKNEVSAVVFYRAAAEQGFATAQNNLGLMYSEGRGGLAKDPVLAYCWLSLATTNGANPAARDFVARTLTSEQQAKAKALLADQQAGRPWPGTSAPARSDSATPTPPTPPEISGAAAARMSELMAALDKAAQANAQFAEANQRLELEKARLEQELNRQATGSEATKLIDQLREQSQRLAGQVQALLTEKETAERDAKVLAAQIKDAREELARARSAPTSTPADVGRWQAEIAALTAKVGQTTEALAQAEQARQELAAANARLQKEKESLAAAPPKAAAGDTSRYPVQEAAKDSIIANLQRDNARLNDEVKSSTRELMSISMQLRNLRRDAGSQSDQPGQADNSASAELRTQNERVAANNARLLNQRDAAVKDAEYLKGQLDQTRNEIARLQQDIQVLKSTRQSSDAASDQLAQLTSKAALSVQEATRRQAENERLAARVSELEKSPRGGTPDNVLASRLAQAEQTATRLQQQVEALSAEKAQLEKSAQSGSMVTADKNAAEATIATLNTQLAQSDQRLAEARAAGSKQEQAAQKLLRENSDLAERARVAEAALAARPAPEDTGPLRQKLAEVRDRAEQAVRERQEQVEKTTAEHNNYVAAQARVATLESELRNARQGTAALGDLQRQLNEAQDRAGQAGREKQALADKVTAEHNSYLAVQSRVATLESDLRIAQQASAAVDELKQQLAVAQDRAALAGREKQALADKVTAEHNGYLATQSRVATLESDLRNAQQASATVDELKQQLAVTQDRAALAGREKQELADKVDAEHSNYLSAQARVATLESDLRDARMKSIVASSAALDDLKRQLAEANAAVEKNGASVAELTAGNDRLEKRLAASTGTAQELAAAQTQLADLRLKLAAAQQPAPELATLREENSRLRQAAEDVATLKIKSEQLARDNDQLAGFMNSNRRDLSAAQSRVAELEKQLEEARTSRTRGGDEAARLRTELAETNRGVERLNATVAELTTANDRLQQDLESARKSTAAALAAQSQAVSAAQPDAYKMEIGTLQARVRELEGQIEDERGNAAKAVATMADQLTRTRETNRSLTDANRALLSARQSETPTVNKDEFDQLQSRVRDLTTGADEVRRQNQKLIEDNQRLASERASLTQLLADARKVATILPGLSDEKAALQERLEAVGAQLLKTQQEIDTLQRESAEATSRALTNRLAAEKAAADLATLQGRTTEAEKAAESHTASVAELTEANTKLENERTDLRRKVTALQADNSRLAQASGTVEQLKVEAERSAQQNIDSLAAQLAQARRDLQSARDANSRLVEGNVAQERDRALAASQLQQQNSALAARLVQAQGTLDQIASAARLGTPASALASGIPAPLPTVSTAASEPVEARMHTVTEGDSLSRISMRYYGTANRWQEIYNANRDVLQGSSILRVGMQLRIP